MAALVLTFLAFFPDDISARDPAKNAALLSQFGQRFALIMLLAQAAIAIVVTLLFVPGAIVEETERRTLTFLLATDLSPREIVLGKLWPRLLLVICVVLAGQPILAITQVWGGVDPAFVGPATIVIIATIWAVGGISCACAVGAKNLRQAIVRSYIWSTILLTLPLFSCPFGVIRALANLHETTVNLSLNNNTPFGPAPGPTATPTNANEANLAIALLVIHVLIQFLIGFFGVRRACHKLRHAPRYYAHLHAAPATPKVAKWEQHPPIPDESPLLWKEVNLSGQTPRIVRMLTLVPWWLWLAVSVTTMLVGLAAALSSTDSVNVVGTINDMVRWGGGLAVGIMALMVGLHAAGSVSRERQQETLTDLLMIPGGRRKILRAKWIGSLSKARGIVLGTIAIPVVGAITEGISFFAVPLLLFAGLAYIACAISFGIFLSVRTTSVQRSTGLWLLLVGLWLGATWLTAETGYMEQRATMRVRTRWVDEAKLEPLVWDRVLCPPLAWSQLSFRLSEYDSFRSWDDSSDGIAKDLEQVIPSVAGSLLFLLLAWIFFAAAAHRFERDGR